MFAKSPTFGSERFCLGSWRNLRRMAGMRGYRIVAVLCSEEISEARGGVFRLLTANGIPKALLPGRHGAPPAV
jgi:hypothetical protein